MAAIDFPNSPLVNDTFTVAGKTWIWTGVVWNIVAEQYYKTERKTHPSFLRGWVVHRFENISTLICKIHIYILY